MDGPWLPDPLLAGRKSGAYLFCFLDDHSRLVPYAEFFFDEALPRMERVLKIAMLRRGMPKAIYVDNGQVYAANQFGAACATLGIQRIHAAPYHRKAKANRNDFFETVRLAVYARSGGFHDRHPGRAERVPLGLAGMYLPPSRAPRDRARPP